MKKLIFSVAVLAAFSTTSCKKAYECTCETSSTSTYAAILDEWQDEVDGYNDQQADPLASDKTVVTIDKTSKAEVNAACTDSENTYMYESEDWNDQDSDFDSDEPAYSRTEVTKVDCTLEKK